MDIWKEKDLVIVKVRYDATTVEAIRKIGEGYWDAERRVWLFPMKKFSVLKALQAEVNINSASGCSAGVCTSIENFGKSRKRNSGGQLRSYQTFDLSEGVNAKPVEALYDNNWRSDRRSFDQQSYGQWRHDKRRKNALGDLKKNLKNDKKSKEDKGVKNNEESKHKLELTNSSFRMKSTFILDDDGKAVSNEHAEESEFMSDERNTLFHDFVPEPLPDYLNTFTDDVAPKMLKPKNAVKTVLEAQIERTLLQMRRYMIQAGYSKQTIKNYVSNVNRFLEFSRGQISVTLVNTYMIELLDNRMCSHAYCNQAINALKLFAKQQGLLSEGYLELVRPKKEYKLPKVLSKEEIKSIIEITENIKHRTALMMGYSCGMRVSEVANLKLADIHHDRGIITIKQSKGRKDRIVPLSKKMAEQLNRYEARYHPYEWLFENQDRTGAITSRTLQNIFNDAKRKVGIVHDASFHSLRHSFATHLMDTGVDIRIIQELLGHASSKTTEIYTHVSTQTIQKIANPLDDL
ncbi:MAG: integrase/recombinase XerD [Clostridiales bacterium]|jgi:integrase/recombinase XerD|nr:integrase/recombinase XerD [Clostridiales bacterium]MDN5300342.1 integrase/recombinase XerD [Clostridiales bacterium]